MTAPIKDQLYAALSPLLANTFAVQLPPNPTFPAIVFQVESEEETGWPAGAGYEQHEVAVLIIAPNLTAIDTLKPQIVAAIEGMPGATYLGRESEGDADYEADPEQYGYFLVFRVRTRI